MTDDPLTLGREMLRAELAEMELRLRIYFDERLIRKADAGLVTSLELSMDKLERGDFTTAQLNAIDARIRAVANAGGDIRWTRWQQVGSLTGAVTTVGMFLLYVLVFVKGLG